MSRVEWEWAGWEWEWAGWELAGGNGNGLGGYVDRVNENRQSGCGMGMGRDQ